MAPSADKRRFERHPIRIRCRMRVDDADHSGFVTDLSANGLFLQCSAKPESGTKVVLILYIDDGDEVTLTGVVARERKVHRAAVAVLPAGVGIALESAPERYFQLVMDLGSE